MKAEIEMKAADLKELTVQELEDKLSDDREAFAKLRFNHAVSDLENPMQLKQRKRDIARMLTELRRRELENDNVA